MATKLPSGNYRVLVQRTIDGKKIRKSFTSSSRAEAEYLAEQWKKNITEASKPENRTIRELCEDYIELKRPILAPSTIAGYEKVLRNSFQDYLDMRMRDVTKVKLQRMIADEAKRGISPKSISNAWGLLSSAMRMYDYEYKVQLPEKADKVVQVLSPSVLVPLVKGTDIELPCMLAMWCGLTVSEIRGIRREDIRDGILYINRVVVDVNGVPMVKEQGKEEKRTRAIRLPDYILDLIPREDPIIKMSRNTILRHFSELLEKNNLPHMTFHQLRHVFATTGAMLNIPSRVMQEKGGWKTPHTMEKVYQHTFTEDRKAADERIDEYMLSFLQES